MTRLPIVGSDNNTWGTILDAFLGVGHNSDGSLIFIVPQGIAIQLTDSLGVPHNFAKMSGSDKAQFNAPSTTEQFQFTKSNGNVLIYLDGGSSVLGLQSGTFLAGQDGSFNEGNILYVDSGGSTNVKSHPTVNTTNILDSSGAVIATFAGTNKIATLKGGQIGARTAVSGNYTILASDHIIAYTSTSSAFVATLPAAAAGNAGQTWIVKDESGAANTNNITVKTAGGTIDGVAGGTGKVINTAYGVLRAYSNGTNYFTF